MSKLDKYINIQKKLLEVYKNKNADYGSKNIDRFGRIGIMVRMQDKINRYITVSSNEISMVNDEKLTDTLEDLINYCYLFLIQSDE